MTLRALLSFDQVPSATAAGYVPQATYGLASLFNQAYGIPGSLIASGAANNATVQLFSGSPSNWLTLGTSSTVVTSGYVISFADLGWLQNGATQGWLGFRTAANSIVGTSSSVVGLLPTGSIGNVGSSITSLLTEAQLARLGVGAAAAQYVEVFLDLTALTYQTYVNGVPNASGSIPPNMQYVVFGGQNFGSANQLWKDFYFLDVDSTKPNGRLGPITATPLVPTLANVQLPNYGSYKDAQISGSATLSTTQAKFGTSSLFSTTTNGSILVPDAPNYRTTTSGDVTYEFWALNTAAAQLAGLLCKDANANPYGRLQYASGSFQFYADGSGSLLVASGAMPVLNQWYHIALVRASGTWTIYQNGVALGSAAGNNTFGNNSSSLQIGNTSASSAAFQGYIDEFRMSNVARYTAAFTPPVAAFTPDANTLLLLHMDNVANGYVAESSGNEPTAFQTPYSGAPSMIPFLQNAASNDQLTASFVPAVANGQKVVAMQYKFAAQAPFAVNMLSNLKQGATVKALPTYQLRDTFAQYSRDIAGIQTAAPDGTAWNATNIAATSLLLQPQSATDPALS